MYKYPRRRLPGLILAIALVVSACTIAQPGSEPPPTSNPPVSFPTPEECDSTGASSPFVFDLDSDELEEVIFIDRTGSDISLVVCIDEETHTLEIDGNNLEVAGFLDLNGNGTAEILIRDETEGGIGLRAASLTLRGLQLTSLAIEQRASSVAGPDETFEGESFQCVDWDGDGDIELIHRRFRPAGAEVNINTSLVEVDGLDVIEGALDSYEEEAERARRIWSGSDGCAPGTSSPKEVRFSEFGWAQATVASELYVDKDDIALVAVAESNGVLAAVGTEAPNVAVGVLLEARPLAWWSTDGLTWSEAEVEGTDAEILDVVSYEGGFLGVGRAGADPAVWQSADGSSWTLATLDTNLDQGQGVMYSVIEVEGALFAVGAENTWSEDGHADSDAAVWTSDDGQSWRRLESASFGTRGYQPNQGEEFNGAIFDVAHDPSVGLVAIGYDSDTDPEIDFPDQYPASWVSVDGSDWVRQRLEHEVRLTGVIQANDMFVTYGSTNLHGSPTADAVILTSIDGFDWVPAQGSFGAIEGEDGIQGINAIRQTPDGTWFALGSDESEFQSRGAIAVWQSTDLLSWTRLAHDVAAFGIVDEDPAQVVSDATTTDDGLLVAVGTSALTVDLTGGGSVCCLYRPHIIAFDPARVEGA